MSLIKLYDTTLRDGTQAEDVSFLVADKIRIAQKLDELGIHYIEGGWPGSNPKDIAFFKDIKKVSLSQAKIAAFGSTRRAKTTPARDNNIQTLIQAEPDVVTIFGKTWDFHVFEALRISLEENLELIYDSLAYLKEQVGEVIYDAEHFFDGYRANPEYALKTLQAAQEAGADCIVLCDTNGGTLPHQIPSILDEVKKAVSTPLGIHTHNDSECAVANSLVAVENGIVHVQGTINGFGERCGNANLCSIIPSLRLKMERECVDDGQLKRLREVSRYIYELANLVPNKHQAYVGNSAFAHKGGVHVSAIQRHPETYEHIRPEPTVLDLGSGAGIDAFVARRLVGEEGRVIGVDMTPSMIERARANAAKLGYGNVEFRFGEIEALPVEDGSVDVVISNCVLNLVPDKAAAFAETFRVLVQGGHFCVSDIVASGALPDGIRKAAALYVGCVAGAIPEADYLATIRSAGFTEVRIAERKPIALPDAALRDHLSAAELQAFRASGVELASVTVLGTRPAACCAADCCS
jgi:isopropylmalate/homocitrate/citramalate synthase